MFALIIQSKQVKACGGSILTEAGKKFLVCNEPSGWIPATGSPFTGNIGGDAKIFSSFEEAEWFAKNWQGHPWYVRPGKRFEVIEVKPKFKQIPDGYEPV